MQLLDCNVQSVCVSAEALLTRPDEDRYCVSDYFLAENLLSTATIPFNSQTVEIELFHCEAGPGDTRLVTLPPADAFLLLLYLEDAQHCDVINGVKNQVRTFREGSICLVNIEAGVSICLHSSLKAISFLLPLSVMDEISERAAPGRNAGFLCPRGRPDPVMHHIGQAFLDLITPGTHQETVLLKHLVAAIGVHLVSRYSTASQNN